MPLRKRLSWWPPPTNASTVGMHIQAASGIEGVTSACPNPTHAIDHKALCRETRSIPYKPPTGGVKSKGHLIFANRFWLLLGGRGPDLSSCAAASSLVKITGICALGAICVRPANPIAWRRNAAPNLNLGGTDPMGNWNGPAYCNIIMFAVYGL